MPQFDFLYVINSYFNRVLSAGILSVLLSEVFIIYCAIVKSRHIGYQILRRLNRFTPISAIYTFDGQTGFPFPLTLTAIENQDLHHFIIAIILYVILFVCWILSATIFFWTSENQPTSAPCILLKPFRLPKAYMFTRHILLEFRWTAIPRFIIIVVGVKSITVLYAADQIPEYAQLNLKVIGHQWYWSYEYWLDSFVYAFDSNLIDTTIPHSNIQAAELILPDRLLVVDYPRILPFQVSIWILTTSEDVIHSYAIPRIGIKMDALPGRINGFFLYCDRADSVVGQCSELCGIGHGFIPIVTHVLDSTHVISYNYDSYSSIFYETTVRVFFIHRRSLRWSSNPIPVSDYVQKHLIKYPTSRNLNVGWNFGSLTGICLIIQIISGVFLAIHYDPNIAVAFDSVEHIIRDVPYGATIRYIHSNGASRYFFCIYIHIGRGIIYESYTGTNKSVWTSGGIILVLSIRTAFIGYVLPWAQISFWGATVITNMLSAIPIVGNSIVQWIWGGYGVGQRTLSRFFVLHCILPFGVVRRVWKHLVALHEKGSSDSVPVHPTRTNRTQIISFYPYFWLKDLLGIWILFYVLAYLVYIEPNLLSHPDNYVPADPIVTPQHIVPEWYFLPFYAMLRRMPSKLGGVILIRAGIGVIIGLSLLHSVRGTKYPHFSLIRFAPALHAWVVITIYVSFIILGWLGGKPAIEPYTSARIVFTILFFAGFIRLLVLPKLVQPETKSSK